MQQKPPHKGKQVEIKWSEQAIASTVNNPHHLSSSKVAQLAHRTWPVLQHGTLNPAVPHEISMKSPLGASHRAFQQSHSPRLLVLGLRHRLIQIVSAGLLSHPQNPHLHRHLTHRRLRLPRLRVYLHLCNTLWAINDDRVPRLTPSFTHYYLPILRCHRQPLGLHHLHQPLNDL